MSRLVVACLVMMRVNTVLSTHDYSEYIFPCGPEDCSESVMCWNDHRPRPLLNSPKSEKGVSSMVDDRLQCEVDPARSGDKSETVLLKRRNDTRSVDFNRSWHDYETGFGSDGNFWIGLKRIHRLSSKGRNILTIQVNNQTSNTYSGFWVDDASTRYTMYVAHGMTDELKASIGQPFTAPDGGIGGCANEFKSGWWFGKNCAHSFTYLNLNGHHNATMIDKLFFNNVDVKTCRMTIKRPFLYCDKTCPNGGTCRKSDNPESYVCDCQPRYTGRRCEVSLEDTTVATALTTTVKAIPMTSRTFTSPTTPSPVDGFDLFVYVYLPISLAIVFLIGMSVLIARKWLISKKKEIHLNTNEETPLVQEDQTTQETSHVRKSKRHKKHRRSKKTGQRRTINILSALDTSH